MTRIVFFLLLLLMSSKRAISSTQILVNYTPQHHEAAFDRGVSSRHVSGHCNYDAIYEKHVSQPYSGSRGISNEVHPDSNHTPFSASLLSSPLLFLHVAVADVSCINGKVNLLYPADGCSS